MNDCQSWRPLLDLSGRKGAKEDGKRDVQELKKYRENHRGHCDVPQKRGKRQLGSWVYRQCVQYLLLKKGKSS